MGFKNLIIAPHPDDEIFWTYSLLCRETAVVIFSKNKNLVHSERVAKEKGHTLITLDFMDTRLSTFMVEMEAVLKDFFDMASAENVFYPSRCHHQDHNAVNDLCKIFFRPSNRHSILNLYEYGYWSDDTIRFDTLNVVTPRKYSDISKISRHWANYVRSLDDYVGYHNGRREPVERFKTILRYGI